jgi:hypothetical protein
MHASTAAFLFAFLLALLVFAICGNAFAQLPPSTVEESAPAADPVPGKEQAEEPAADPSIEELVRKILLAYGGREKLALQETDYVIQGTMKRLDPSEGGRRFKETRSGQKYRLDLDNTEAGTRASIVYDAQSGWTAEGRKATDLAPAAVNEITQTYMRRPSVFAHVDEPGHKLRLVGRTQYQQIPVYSVEVTVGDESPSTYFVDQNNYLIHAVSYSRKTSPDKADNVFVEYAEYRPVASSVVPFKESEYVNGKLKVERTIDSVAFDAHPDASAFKRPEAAIAPRLAQPVSIPFEYARQQIIVKTRINGGEPLDFVFDTGASETIVDRRTAAENFLDKRGSANIRTAAGAVTTQRSEIDKVELGGLALQGVSALVLDLSPHSSRLGRRIGGIVGTNVFNQFVVTIDFAKKQIVFRDPSSFQTPVGSTPASFLQPGVPVVRGLLNAKDEQAFLIDTGAVFNHLPESVAKRYSQGQPLHLTEGIGLDDRPVRLGTVVLDSVEVAGHKLRKVNFTFPHQQSNKDENPPRGGFFETLNLGILGNPFWQNFILTLDYKTQRVFLAPNVVQQTADQIATSTTTGDDKLIIQRDYRGAEVAYQRALSLAVTAHDTNAQARLLGRLGNLHRVMAKDLRRPEQTRVAYDYFNKAQAAINKTRDRETHARILADWSLLYSDNGQHNEARSAIESALSMSPNDPFVNVDYAVQLYRSKSYPQMQQYVDKTLFLDPANWQALWYQVKLAELYNDQGRVKSTLKEILRFYPWSKLAAQKLGALQAP